MLTAMDVSGGKSARGARFLAQVLKPLPESRPKMPNTRMEIPKMDRGNRGERDRRATSQRCSCTIQVCVLYTDTKKSWSWLLFHITKA